MTRRKDPSVFKFKFSTDKYPLLESRRWRKIPTLQCMENLNLSDFSEIFSKPVDQLIDVEWESNYRAIRNLLFQASTKHCLECRIFDSETQEENLFLMVRVPLSKTYDLENRKCMGIAEQILQKIKEDDIIDEDVYYEVLNERIIKDWEIFKPELIEILQLLKVTMLDDHIYDLYELIYMGNDYFLPLDFRKSTVQWYLKHTPSIEWYAEE